MRISKMMAQEIALKALEKRKSRLDEFQQDNKEFVTKIVLDSLPEQVKKTFDMYPGYFDRHSYFNFTCGDANSRGFDSSEYLPKKDNGYINIDSELMGKLERNRLNYLKEKDRYKSDLNELEAAIFNLRTINRVREELPDLKEFLPDDSVTALVPSLDKARVILKQLNK